MRFKIVIATIFALSIAGGAQTVFSQNMSNTVVTKTIKFAKGKSQATIPGTAKYGMSYVFDLVAKAGQTMKIDLAGKNSDLTFSLIRPDEETIDGAFGIWRWNGRLPQTGKYSIVVVLNDAKAAPVRFSLEVKIN